MGWQPIETAPREHLARFLAYAEPRSDAEPTVFEVKRFSDQWGDEIRLAFGYATVSEKDILDRLSHWMPLPPAPEQSA